MPAHAAWSRRGEGERFLSGVLMHFSSRFLFVFLGFLAARSNLVTTINHDRDSFGASRKSQTDTYHIFYSEVDHATAPLFTNTIKVCAESTSVGLISGGLLIPQSIYDFLIGDPNIILLVFKC